MQTDKFDFDLPAELIAQKPASPRDSSRLLEVFPEKLEDRKFQQLPDLLRPGDLLVLNDTRVIPTKLRGKRDNVKIEVTLHKPSKKEDEWFAFARPGRRLRKGDRVNFREDFSATIIEKRSGGEVLISLEAPNGGLMDAIYANGQMPIPPYIQRPEDCNLNDNVDYQTIYARQPGAVAAPTAGLHFTQKIFHLLAERGIEKKFVTLHVGAGTFLPIKSETLNNHQMHAEYGVVSSDVAEAIQRTRSAGGRVIAVGSTVLRLIETAAQPDGSMTSFTGKTDLFIRPGYRFKVADLFLTNFHLPRSTLFVLVSAFSGIERMKSAYKYAITKNYRFYSYGDCCLLHKAHLV